MSDLSLLNTLSGQTPNKLITIMLLKDAVNSNNSEKMDDTG